MKSEIRYSLSFKFTLAISVVIIITSVVLSWFFINGQSLLLQSSIENKGIIIAHSLAASCEYGVVAKNHDFLSSLTKDTIKKEDVLYSVIYDDTGNILSSSLIPTLNINKFIEQSTIDRDFINSIDKDGLETKIFSIDEVGDIVEILVPMVSYNSSSSYTFLPVNPMMSAKVKAPQTIGLVRVGLTLERIKYQISKVTRSIILLTIVVIFAAIVISIFLIKIIIRPINELVIGTKQIAYGKLDYRVPLTSKDEFRDLAISFNSMASDMEVQIKELNKEKKKLLNLKVAFEERSQELEETLKKVQSIQKDLINAEKFATIGRLSSSVAHELRNPLASIKNISYFLLKMGNHTDEKEKKMIQMLSDEVVRANKIITELLDYSKTKQLNKLEIGIAVLIDKAIKSVPVAENIKVIENSEPLVVLVDPDRIVQVLINLISNARDAMPQNGGTITISTSKSQDELIIKVTDNASGMSEETLTKLFEPLFTTKLKGIGLGLPIVKEIIEAHGGKILVTSKLGVGTEFTILLPMA